MKGLRVILVAMLSLMLVACSGTTSKPAETKPAEQPAPAAPAPAPAPAPAKPKVVGISQLVAHPSLDLIQKGILDELKDQGFEDGKNIKVDLQTAQGDAALTKSIADKFVADKADVIVTLTTPSGQSAVKATQNTKIPVVFAAVSDPVAAGMLKTVKEPSGTNVTGMYNFDPLEAQLDLFAQIMPNLNSLGVIFNPGESNSQTNVKRLKELTAARNWKLIEAPVSGSNEVQTAAQSLIGRVQAVYMPQDNTVVSAFEALVKVTRDAKTPLFVSDGQSVKRGAIATVGGDDYKNGRQAGAIVARILKGEDPGKVLPEQVKNRGIIINKKAADAYGLKIPEAIAKNATDMGE